MTAYKTFTCTSKASANQFALRGMRQGYVVSMSRRPSPIRSSVFVYTIDWANEPVASVATGQFDKRHYE